MSAPGNAALAYPPLVLSRAAGAAAPRPPSFLRHSRLDLLLVGLAGLHGVLLCAAPGAIPIALALWWSSNTIAHDFLHKPFFSSRILNRLFGLYLTLVLGVPQTLWRSRHLAHHAETAWKLRFTPGLAVELTLLAGLWGALATAAPGFFLGSYLPGLALGLCICALHGREEHAGGTTSHRGRLYNFIFLNDGYHAEHHRAPGIHWSRLPLLAPVGRESRWPPVLRWLDALSLEGLERAAIRSKAAQRFLIRSHERAFRKLLRHIDEPRTVGIVGGGLFPRTALVLEKLLPRSRIVILDRCEAHLAMARSFLGDRIELVHAMFDAKRSAPFDLVVIPLSFAGDRSTVYEDPPARAAIVHDWCWRRRGRGALVSMLLLKRLNLVSGPQSRRSE